ncbi:hypothetical protein NL676_015519 [Syzygium grande]|nr:hypothetical protein NL676_015519 [Syzygium grande]
MGTSQLGPEKHAGELAPWSVASHGAPPHVAPSRTLGAPRRHGAVGGDVDGTGSGFYASPPFSPRPSRRVVAKRLVFGTSEVEKTRMISSSFFPKKQKRGGRLKAYTPKRPASRLGQLPRRA